MATSKQSNTNILNSISNLLSIMDKHTIKSIYYKQQGDIEWSIKHEIVAEQVRESLMRIITFGDI
jgi:hypothetical protein